VTIVVNVFSSLDVYVKDDESELPIAGAEVCLYDDSAQTVLIDCVETDVDGLARFFFVGDLFEDTTFTSNASADGYESEATTFEYSLLTDLDSNGLVDDATTADRTQSLDPDGGGTPPPPVGNFLDVLVTLNGNPTAGVTVYLQFQFVGLCSASNFYYSAVSDVNGIATFSLLDGDLPGNFQACGDPNGDTVLTQLFPVTIPLLDPAGDIDGTLAEVSGP
jgi:hypothetical protein